MSVCQTWMFLIYSHPLAVLDMKTATHMALYLQLSTNEVMPFARIWQTCAGEFNRP